MSWAEVVMFVALVAYLGFRAWLDRRDSNG